MLRINRMLTILLLVALLLSACQPIQPVVIEQAPASKLDGPTINQIETLVKGIMDAKQVPGVAVGIVKAGELVYAKGFGVAEFGSDRPVTTKTLFHMASLNKTVVAITIMQLVEAGKLDLDNPVTNYLPNFKLADGRYKDITVRQLLSHRSGMPDIDSAVLEREFRTPRTDDAALDEYVRSMGRYELLSAPDESFSYSCIGFDILGDIVAKVSGESYEQYAQDHIFSPLGMADTTSLLSEADPQQLAAPHAYGADGKPQQLDYFPYTRVHAPCNNLYTNIDDLSRLAIADLNRGELDGKRILAAKAYDELWTPTGKTGWDEWFGPAWSDYGLGWFIGEVAGHPIFSHPGADEGFQSEMMLVPDRELGVVSAVNLFDAEDGALNAYIVADEVLKLLLGDEPAVAAPAYIEPTASLDDATVTKIETILTNTMQAVNVPGYAMCVVKDGNVVYNKGFGTIKLGSDQPVTPQSVFAIRSTTKSFTAVALMQLVEQGKVDLDAPVTKYLPYFTMADPAYQQITVRMLASHTSGLIDDESFANLPPRSEEPVATGTAIEWFVRALADDKLTAAPPTVWQYAGTNFILLGDIIGKVSGEPYDLYITKHLLEPLDMTHSTLDATTIPAGALVGEHVTTAGVVEATPLSNYGGFEAPEGGIYSTCEDMTRWMQVHLNRGELDGVRILKAETYNLMWKPQIETGMGEFFGAWIANMAHGWAVGEEDGYLLAGHPGGGAGQNIGYLLAPDDNLGVIVLANWGTEPDAYPAWTAAADVVYALLGIKSK